MKRATFRIVFFLLLGAILNVAVAWGCVWMHGDVEASWSPFHNPRGLPSVVHVTSRGGYEQVRGVARSGTLLDRHGDEVRQYGTNAWWPSEATKVLSEAYGIAAGWPLLALSACRTTNVHIDHDADEIVSTPVLRWGILWDQDAFVATGYSSPEFAPRIFPFRPIWPGIAINTLIYATLGWLLLGGPFQVRRLIRHNLGLCTKCGYDLRGYSGGVCPECGATP